MYCVKYSATTLVQSPRCLGPWSPSLGSSPSLGGRRGSRDYAGCTRDYAGYDGLGVRAKSDLAPPVEVNRSTRGAAARGYDRKSLGEGVAITHDYYYYFYYYITTTTTSRLVAVNCSTRGAAARGCDRKSLGEGLWPQQLLL